MKARYRRVQHRDLRSHVIDLDDLYRYRPRPKPRRLHRLRRRHAARLAAMSPAERFIYDELRAGLTVAWNEQILYGDGTSPGPMGLHS